MTLEQLKSLKIGDIVRYTNKEDATDCTDWKVDRITTLFINFIEKYNENNFFQVPFDDLDIEYIASQYALVPPATTNELQIILHQIRDCEFDLDMVNKRYNAYLISNADIGTMQTCLSIIQDASNLLLDLRNKRDNLLKQNI